LLRTRIVALAVTAALAGCGGGATSIPASNTLPPQAQQATQKPTAHTDVNAVNVASNIYVVVGNTLREYPVTANGNTQPKEIFTFPSGEAPSGRIAVRPDPWVSGTYDVFYATGNMGGGFGAYLVDRLTPGNNTLQTIWTVEIGQFHGATDVVVSDSYVPTILVPGTQTTKSSLIQMGAFTNGNIAGKIQSTFTWSGDTNAPAQHIALDPLDQSVWFGTTSSGVLEMSLVNQANTSVFYTQTTNIQWPQDQEEGIPITAYQFDVNENEQLVAAAQENGFMNLGTAVVNLIGSPTFPGYEAGDQLSNVLGVASDKSNIYTVGVDQADKVGEIVVVPDGNLQSASKIIVDSTLSKASALTIY